MDKVMVAENFLKAVVYQNCKTVSDFLTANAGLYIRGQGRIQVYWSRPQVLAALLGEFSQWEEPALNIWHSQATSNLVALAFQLRGMRNGHPAKQSRSIVLAIHGWQVTLAQLHYDNELPSMTPEYWLVPPSLVNVLARQLGWARMS